MINNSSPQKWDRLSQKQLNQQFINELLNGMQCSRFEAKAILDTVYKVYEPYFFSNGSLHPGQVQMQCAAIDNSPQTKLADCTMVTVTLTLDAGSQDRKSEKLMVFPHYADTGLSVFAMKLINRADSSQSKISVIDCLIVVSVPL